MSKVCVMRTGSAWSLDGSKSTPEGEQGECTAVAEALKRAGHEVILAGKLNGILPGFQQVSWHITGSYVSSTCAKRAYDQCLAFVEELARHEPEVIVEVVGQCPTLSNVLNDRGVTVQDFAAKYVLPGLMAMQQLRLPRICVITDFRTYPRTQEISYWPYCRPVAVLSQEDRVFSRKIFDKKYEVRAVHAHCENWWSHGLRPETSTRKIRCCVVAHSHFRDSRYGKKQRAEVWRWILGDDVIEDVEIYGKGWDGWESWRGILHPTEVLPTLRTATCGPMISIEVAWTTAKLRQYALSGALPLPYGRGEEALTYDRGEEYVPFDSEIRFGSSEELAHLIRRANQDETFCREECDRVIGVTEPDFWLLQDCVRHFTSGGGQVQRYGGYYDS